MLCNLPVNKSVLLYHMLLFFIHVPLSLLPELSRNNQFEWIAAKPGRGEFFLSVKHRRPKSVQSHTDSSPEESSAIRMTQHTDTYQADSLLFPGPEDGCTKSYMTHRRLEQHLMYGKHEFRLAESLFLLDRAKVSYAERFEAGGSHSEVTIMHTEIHCGSPCLPEGWAGRKSAKPHHDTDSIPSKKKIGGKVSTWRDHRGQG